MYKIIFLAVPKAKLLYDSVIYFYKFFSKKHD